MTKSIPEHFRLDQSIQDSLVHLVGKAMQIGYNLEATRPEELKLRLEQLCVATEQAGAFVGIVNKWCGRLPPEIVDLIPTWVLLDAEANSKE